MPEIALRDGTTTEDPRLDRLKGYQDPKSRLYGIVAAIDMELPPRSFTHQIAFWEDQGNEGACVEYAIVHEMLARPVLVPHAVVVRILAEHGIYWPAQREDPWPGGSYPGASPFYEGTAVLAGMKVAQRLGFFPEYRWAFGLHEAVMALSYKGPVVLGIDWWSNMRNPDADGFLSDTGRIVGGHAILAHAVKIVFKAGTVWKTRTWADVDLDRSYIVVHNSWGRDWGVNGRAKIRLSALGRLLASQGECVIPMRRALGPVAA